MNGVSVSADLSLSLAINAYRNRQAGMEKSTPVAMVTNQLFIAPSWEAPKGPSTVFYRLTVKTETCRRDGGSVPFANARDPCFTGAADPRGIAVRWPLISTPLFPIFTSIKNIKMSVTFQAICNSRFSMERVWSMGEFAPLWQPPLGSPW